MKIDISDVRAANASNHERTLSPQQVSAPVRLPRMTGDRARQSDTQQLLNQVNQALHHSGYEQLRAVRAYCLHGRIVLHGRISTYFLKQVAQEVLRNVANVTEVDNDLHVVCGR